MGNSRQTALRSDRIKIVGGGLVGLALALGLLAGLIRPAGPALAQTNTPTPTFTPTLTPTPTLTVTPTPTPTSTPSGLVQPAPTVVGATPGPTTPITGAAQVRIRYPQQGQIILIQPFLVLLDVAGIRLNARAIGTPSRPNEGHWVLLVDGTPVASGDTTQFSIGGVPEGLHTLTVQLRNNDRSPLLPPVEDSVLIDVGGVGLAADTGEDAGLPPNVPAVRVGEPADATREDDETLDLPEVPGGLPRTGGPLPAVPILPLSLGSLGVLGAGVWLRRRSAPR